MKHLKSVVLSAVAASTLFGTTVTVPVTGWNLMGAMNAINPYSTFNQANVKSVWAWNATAKKWIAYAPSGSNDSGGISTLATNNQISLFDSNGTISAGSGFWINTIGTVSYEANATTVPTVTAPTIASQPTSFPITQGVNISSYSFAQFFANTTNTTTYSGSFNSGNGVPGMDCNSTTGTVSGTPTTTGAYTGHITACNGTACVSTNDFTITVNPQQTYNSSAPYFYNIQHVNNVPTLYVAKNTALDINLTKYARDNEGGTIAVSASGSSSLPSGLSFSNGKITGTTTATTPGTLGVTLSDGTNTNTYTLNIVPIDPVTIENGNKIFVYGANVTSIVNLATPTSFFNPGKNDGTDYIGVISLGSIDGSYNEYNLSGSSFATTPSYTETFTLGTPSQYQVNATFPSGEVVTMHVTSAQEVATVNGVPTTGLKEATVTMTTLTAPTLANVTDWWTTHYTTWNQSTNSSVPITSLTALRDMFVSGNSENVWFDNDYQVKLDGNTTSTSGNAIGMVWDGTYNQCTGNDCGSPYYKNMISTGTTVGSWSLANNYLTVSANGHGQKVFRVNGSTLQETEIPVAGSVKNEKWLFGPDLATFESVYLQVEHATTAP